MKLNRLAVFKKFISRMKKARLRKLHWWLFDWAEYLCHFAWSILCRMRALFGMTFPFKFVAKAVYGLSLTKEESTLFCFERVVYTSGEVAFVDLSSVFYKIFSQFTIYFFYEELILRLRDFRQFGEATHDLYIVFIMGVFVRLHPRDAGRVADCVGIIMFKGRLHISLAFWKSSTGQFIEIRTFSSEP